MTKKKSFDFKTAATEELIGILKGRNPDNLSSRHVRTALVRSWTELRSRGKTVRDLNRCLGEVRIRSLIEHSSLFSTDELVMFLTIDPGVFKSALAVLKSRIRQDETIEAKIKLVWPQISPSLQAEVGPRAIHAWVV
ncbi:MAG: hypothetical protein COV08_01460 [Candidatus Vogelbacteria bacterium CG10_big_fil_rev_8_21_14_0_10_49_38]|uniref:Uncharacterized protein n=1 Tax=Candidatus Vogelbacteria bacterium CG10_big_fil_rev_8_21_14_0_10_49_38 TaxID=1975043 RepID=A0A2H0RHX8_9BACT|nr:MAG: hypothetical protein BK006_01475 [bacterium CG10_49_38]PIR46067.1 MAG: hypothetical protein COV08_01460 [Candidatus Vogelbacteria bacterium CG10_big_fil_rev_8_21_14_0_10_49_38]